MLNFPPNTYGPGEQQLFGPELGDFLARLRSGSQLATAGFACQPSWQLGEVLASLAYSYWLQAIIAHQACALLLLDILGSIFLSEGELQVQGTLSNDPRSLPHLLYTLSGFGA